MTTNLRFHFHGGQTSLFKDLTEEVVKNILAALQDSRVDSFVIGNQWINKSGIITVFPELDPVVQEVPAEAECTSCVEPMPQSDQPA